MPQVTRTRFRNEIVAECSTPASGSSDVEAIVLATGVPSVPKHKDVLQFWSRKGYWVFYPRYRGTWESDGCFLDRSPALDITDIAEDLSHYTSVRDLFTGTDIPCQPSRIHIIGVSFGGPAAFFASNHTSVTSATAISPVVDFREESDAEPMDWLYQFLGEAFGGAYRFSDNGWSKLAAGDMYNPASHTDAITPAKCFIVHGGRDVIELPATVSRFAARTGIPLRMNGRDGHMGLSDTTRFFLSRAIRRHMAAQSRVQSSS